MQDHRWDPSDPVDIIGVATVNCPSGASKCLVIGLGGGVRRGWTDDGDGDPRSWACRFRAVVIIYNYMVVDYDLADEEVDRIFHALADRTRRDILSRAIEREQSVSSLARQYDMSFAAVQKHVAVLERATLILKEPRGREQIVHANGPTITRAIALLDQYEQLWIDRANQIAAILESEEGEPQ